MDDIYTKEVSAEVLGKIFGISKTRVSRLNSQGVISAGAKNKYQLGPTVKAYVEHLKKYGDEGSPKATLEIETARIAALKREKSELELEVYKGDLHKTEHIRLMVGQMISATKQKFLALPVKLAPKIVGLKSTSDIQIIVSKEINDALTELSEFNPEQHLDEIISHEEVSEEDEETED